MNCICGPASATFHQGHHQECCHPIWVGMLLLYLEVSAVTLCGRECLLPYVEALWRSSTLWIRVITMILLGLCGISLNL